MNKKMVILLTALALCGIMSGMAQANVTYGFERITSNSSTDVAGQLLVEISHYDVKADGIHQVLFLFKNTGPEQSVIRAIYFADGVLLGMAGVVEASNGVSYKQRTKDSTQLPGGGNWWDENATQIFIADAAKPACHKGVGPNEQVGIVFDLQAGLTLDHVLEFLSAGLNSEVPYLRIGLHVISLPDGESDSFVNGPPIPAPGALLLGSIGVGVVGWLRRRRTL